MSFVYCALFALLISTAAAAATPSQRSVALTVPVELSPQAPVYVSEHAFATVHSAVSGARLSATLDNASIALAWCVKRAQRVPQDARVWWRADGGDGAAGGGSGGSGGFGGSCDLYGIQAVNEAHIGVWNTMNSALRHGDYYFGVALLSAASGGYDGVGALVDVDGYGATASEADAAFGGGGGGGAQNVSISAATLTWTNCSDAEYFGDKCTLASSGSLSASDASVRVSLGGGASAAATLVSVRANNTAASVNEMRLVVYVHKRASDKSTTDDVANAIFGLRIVGAAYNAPIERTANDSNADVTAAAVAAKAQQHWALHDVECVHNRGIPAGGDVTLKCTVIAPLNNAQWFFQLHLLGDDDNDKVAAAAAQVNATISIEYTQCDDTREKRGEIPCAHSTEPLPSTAPGDALNFTALDSAVGDHFWYLFVGEAGQKELDVAFASLDGTEPPPLVLARYGAPPTENTYDLINCTLSAEECSKVHRLSANVPSSWSSTATSIIDSDGDIDDDSARWFVAVASGNYRKYDVLVWDASGDACASNCTSASNGACDARTLVCACTDDYEGVNCALRVPILKPWQWALIIGSGVLVSIACIGAIVFFLQREGNEGYQKV